MLCVVEPRLRSKAQRTAHQFVSTGSAGTEGQNNGLLTSMITCCCLYMALSCLYMAPSCYLYMALSCCLYMALSCCLYMALSCCLYMALSCCLYMALSCCLYMALSCCLYMALSCCLFMALSCCLYRVSKKTWTFLENAITPSFMDETFKIFCACKN